MNKLFTFLLLTFTIKAFSQAAPFQEFGKEVAINIEEIRSSLNNGAVSSIIQLPMPSGTVEDILVSTSPLFLSQPADILTYSGTSSSSQSVIKVSITPSGLTAAVHYKNAYYFIEPIDAKAGRYKIYNLNEAPEGNCRVDDEFIKKEVQRQGRIASISPFPVGTQLRVFRMAAAATGEMTAALGGKTQARDRIVAIINGSNLIYEIETAIRFSLISKTITSQELIFDNASTDPFTVDPNFASSGNAQAGFNTLNGNNSLLYSEYDIGHVFHSSASLNGAGGQAGPTPCSGANKASAWTQFNPNFAIGSVVNLYVHEVGHQFQAWHTYNAVGGDDDSPTFCTSGWDAATAIEPGSGSTLMAYGNNCWSPTNYVLTEPNNENYFHTKSLEQIFTSLNTVSTCFTTTATGNTPPTSSAGPDITIPKGTPFTLVGVATDPDATQTLSYVWEQYDIATAAGDKGALGSLINGVGGYPAVNSTASAPLFRSKISGSPVRNFPNMNFILNNANDPADNEGEDLPQAGRTMNFRFTVRDNAANGGGVDSDEMVITVDGTTGPLELTAFNTATTMAAGSSQTINWDVNGTNSISGNVKISLSTDGGSSFPYTLSAATLNDGTEVVTIPANVVASTNGRIKVSSLHHPTAEFFDLNNANLTITSACLAKSNTICPDNAVSANQGDASLDLSIIGGFTTPSSGNALAVDVSGAPNRSVLQNTGSGGCSVSNPRSSVLIPFQVNSNGTYAISFTSGFYGMTILNSSTISCANFVGSSITGGTYSSSFDAVLSVCNTYYLIVYDIFNQGNTNINFNGPGIVLNVETAPSGFNYTFAAINKATNQISAVSASANFTSIGAGDYDVVGLAFENSFNPTSLINQTVSQAYGTGSCILFSGNSKRMSVIGSPCPPSLSFVSPADDIASGTVKQETSGAITATNALTGGNVVYDAGSHILLNPGFVVNNGVVFTAYIDGCGGQ